MNSRVPRRQPLLGEIDQNTFVLLFRSGWPIRTLSHVMVEKIGDHFNKSDEPTYEGEYARVADIYFRPQPVRKPHPPIWIGGDSMPALRRTARLGDGWFPVGISPKKPLNTVARYKEAADTLARLAEEAGRDPAEIALTFWAVWFDETKRVTLDDGSRHIFTGESEEIAEDISGMAEIGVSAILFNFIRDTVEETLDSTERFAKEVMPLVKK